MAEDLRQRVARQIEEAFADTPYPDDENISHYEYELPVEDFQGKHWKAISLKIIFRERGELSFFTPDAYRFYLPAFMRATLLHYSEVDTLSGNLIIHLSPEKSDASLKRFFLQMNSGFNREEEAAILAFLEAYLVLWPDEYSEVNTVYRPLLDSAIEYWKQILNTDES